MWCVTRGSEYVYLNYSISLHRPLVNVLVNWSTRAPSWPRMYLKSLWSCQIFSPMRVTSSRMSLCRHQIIHNALTPNHQSINGKNTTVTLRWLNTQVLHTSYHQCQFSSENHILSWSLSNNIWYKGREGTFIYTHCCWLGDMLSSVSVLWHIFRSN